MIKRIIRYPSDHLTTECAWIDDPASIIDHIQDLRDTLAVTLNGVALASNQISAQGYRVFVTRPGRYLPEIIINPRWKPTSGSQAVWLPEGCLSVPELRDGRAARQTRVELWWCDQDLAEHRREFSGLDAQIIQHECEHLEGHTVVSHQPLRARVQILAEAIKNKKMGR